MYGCVGVVIETTGWVHKYALPYKEVLFNSSCNLSYMRGNDIVSYWPHFDVEWVG